MRMEPHLTNPAKFLSGPIPLDRMVVLFCFQEGLSHTFRSHFQKGMLFPKRPITFTSLLVTRTLNLLGLRY